MACSYAMKLANYRLLLQTVMSVPLFTQKQMWEEENQGHERG